MKRTHGHARIFQGGFLDGRRYWAFIRLAKPELVFKLWQGKTLLQSTTYKLEKVEDAENCTNYHYKVSTTLRE